MVCRVLRHSWGFTLDVIAKILCKCFKGGWEAIIKGVHHLTVTSWSTSDLTQSPKFIVSLEVWPSGSRSQEDSEHRGAGSSVGSSVEGSGWTQRNYMMRNGISRHWGHPCWLRKSHEVLDLFNNLGELKRWIKLLFEHSPQWYVRCWDSWVEKSASSWPQPAELWANICQFWYVSWSHLLVTN